MEGSWWKDEKDIKDEQKAVVNLKPNGKYLVLGPPGSGKTNLLLLRLKWLAASGKKNVIFLTLGRSLSEFIKTGIGAKKIVEPEQIKTVMRWAMDLAADSAPNLLHNMPDSYEERRNYFSEHLNAITVKMPSGYYDAIVVDEVQDLQGSELTILERLSPRIMAAGDSRQSIYSGNGIDAALKAGFELKELQFHYRIGKKICSVADMVYPPDEDHPSLLQKCQYDEKLPSSAEPVECSSLEEQCKRLVENVRLQLRAYPGESVGVLVPTFKNGIFGALRDALDGSDFCDLVEYHGEDGREFPPNKRVFVLTCHSAKGMEFRAVNLVAAERMYSGYLSKRTLQFTSITRAKTSLRVYYTGKLPLAMATAFASEQVPDLGSII